MSGLREQAKPQVELCQECHKLYPDSLQRDCDVCRSTIKCSVEVAEALEKENKSLNDNLTIRANRIEDLLKERKNLTEKLEAIRNMIKDFPIEWKSGRLVYEYTNNRKLYSWMTNLQEILGEASSRTPLST